MLACVLGALPLQFPSSFNVAESLPLKLIRLELGARKRPLLLASRPHSPMRIARTRKHSISLFESSKLSAQLMVRDWFNLIEC